MRPMYVSNFDARRIENTILIDFESSRRMTSVALSRARTLELIRELKRLIPDELQEAAENE